MHHLRSEPHTTFYKYFKTDLMTRAALQDTHPQFYSIWGYHYTEAAMDYHRGKTPVENVNTNEFVYMCTWIAWIQPNI